MRTSPTEPLNDLAAVIVAREKLRAGGELDRHYAARLTRLGAEMLQKALDEGLDRELILDDLPGQIPGVEPSDPAGDVLLEELQHLECENCLDHSDAPRGFPRERAIEPIEPIPSPNQSLAAVVDPASVGERPQPEAPQKPRRKRSLGSKKYLACSTPHLERAGGGRKVWMSVCAYQESGSRRVRMLAKIVSENASFPPRSAVHLGGKRVPFVSLAELDALVGKHAD